MIVNFDGRSDSISGEAPKTPVKWTGTFLVTDFKGNVIKAVWERNSAPPMHYQGARYRAGQLIDNLTARLFEQHKMKIKTATFTLKSR